MNSELLHSSRPKAGDDGVQAIIFDLDGTLLNTLDDLYASVSYALTSHRLALRLKSEVRRYLGNGIRRLIEQSVPANTPASTTEEVLATFKQYYLKHSLDLTRPYDGVVEMVHQCKQMGLKTAIVSNKVDAAVQDLHRRFFSDCIDIAIGETPDVRRKPAPDMVMKAIQQLGVDARHCVYMGDSEVDMQTALNSGLRFIAVSWGFRDRDVLEHLNIEHIIDKPQQCFDLLS